MKLVNKTRVSKSIPRKLIREGRIYLLPLYFIMQLSHLAREGIENSGSHEFADHIYKSIPQGKFGVGIILDKILLSLPSSRSFRNRYIHSRDQIVKYAIKNSESELNILSVPSGIPRELVEAAVILRNDRPEVFNRIHFYCLDTDPVAHSKAKILAQEFHLENFMFIPGDAFLKENYSVKFDVIVSTGFGEFLTDAQLSKFYEICFHALKEGGIFVSAATLRHKLSDYLMRHIAELLTQYREEEKLLELLKKTSFVETKLARDSVGYQVFIRAEKKV